MYSNKLTNNNQIKKSLMIRFFLNHCLNLFKIYRFLNNKEKFKESNNKFININLLNHNLK